MKKRHLGGQGLEVSAVGLGCGTAASASFSGPIDQATQARIMRYAIERGVTFLDTTEANRFGDSETPIGIAVKGMRDQVVIGTKFGYAEEHEGPPPLPADSRPERIRRVVDEMLRRLDVDVIDILYQHRVDPKVPIEDVAGCVGELVEAGKVRFFGLCEAAPNTIRRAHAVHPVSAVQSEYSLWCRDVEDGVLPTCRELGIGFVPFSPLGRGFLGGTGTDLAELPENDFRRSMPKWQGDNLATNRALVAALADIARGKGITPAQLALAWLLHQGDDIVPIPATVKPHRVDENAAAADIALSTGDLAAIDRVAPKGAFAGARYNEHGMKSLDR